MLNVRFPYVFLLLAACGDNLNSSDDEPPTGDSQIAISAPAAVEERDELTVTVSRTGDGAGTASVTYATTDGSATAGLDYTAATGTLTWEDGDTADKTITIPVLADLAVEGTEQLEVTLSAATGATLGTASATTEITDDDRLGDAVVVTSTGRVVTFDRAAPGTVTSAITISGLVDGETVLGADVRPADGQLYALTSAGKLYRIDSATGAATLVSTLAADPADTTNAFTALTGTRFGLDFNPVPDRLRVVSDTGQNLRINVATGATVTDGAINGVVTGHVAAGYTSSFATACRTQLFTIDVASDRLLLQNPPNDGTTVAVGALGVDATDIVGFDVSTSATGANTALAMLTVGGQTQLYTIDLASGAATVVGGLALEAGETVRDFATVTPDATAAIPQAPGELYGANASNVLVSFTRAAPAKACTTATITGLAAGDQIAGIDFRPSTGVLHALTNAGGTGKLYTVDVATGAASLLSTLAVPLTGTDFGMDFNPTGPVALRIVSDTGQNLRVTDVTTGATTADGALNGAGTGAVAAGYTDAVPGAATTTLYVIDSAADRLRLQVPPNLGTLVDVGPLGVDLEGVAALDIDGRDNTAFLAATVAGSTTSTLHTVNLMTGAASASLGTIAGGERLVGLARPTPSTTVIGLRGANELVTFAPGDPSQVTLVGPITGLAGENLIGLDVRASTGVLHGVGSAGGVYRIDPVTAVATRLVPLTADASDATLPYLGLAGTDFGFDFNPTGPVALRIVSNDEQNLRVGNVLAGNTFTDTTLARDGQRYAIAGVAYTNNVPGATTTALYALDREKNKLLTIAPPNSGTLREIGVLGFDVHEQASFEIVSATLALAIDRDGTTTTLYSVDLGTGAATAIGAVGIAGEIVGLTAPVSATAPAADSPVFAVTAAGVLARFPRNAPGTVTTIGTVTGLTANDAVLAIDVRPSTDELWLLARNTVSSAARLYRVDPATAVATLVGTLVAEASDATAPYTSIGGARVGMDFNPTGPVALRIVDDTGLNLRIVNPAGAGGLVAVTTDAVLMRGAPDVVAAAYTNSYAGATTTALYVFDAASASILQQTPPNDGILVTLNAIAPTATFTGLAGFDIAGGNNGVALLAAQVAGETFSRLYRINLTTGVATEVGTGIAGAPLRGLAITVR